MVVGHFDIVCAERESKGEVIDNKLWKAHPNRISGMRIDLRWMRHGQNTPLRHSAHLFGIAESVKTWLKGRISFLPTAVPSPQALCERPSSVLDQTWRYSYDFLYLNISQVLGEELAGVDTR